MTEQEGRWVLEVIGLVDALGQGMGNPRIGLLEEAARKAVPNWVVKVETLDNEGNTYNVFIGQNNAVCPRIEDAKMMSLNDALLVRESWQDDGWHSTVEWSEVGEFARW